MSSNLKQITVGNLQIQYEESQTNESATHDSVIRLGYEVEFEIKGLIADIDQALSQLYPNHKVIYTVVGHFEGGLFREIELSDSDYYEESFTLAQMKDEKGTQILLAKGLPLNSAGLSRTVKGHEELPFPAMRYADLVASNEGVTPLAELRFKIEFGGTPSEVLGDEVKIRQLTPDEYKKKLN